MRHVTFACLATIILAFAVSTAQAGTPAENQKALRGAITCFNDSSEVGDHISELVRSKRYVPPRRWNTSSCDLALLVSKQNGSAELTRTLSAFATSLTSLAADVDGLMLEKQKPVVSADTHGALVKLAKTLEANLTARKALSLQIDKEEIEFDRADLAALAKKEKKKKEKSSEYYRLVIKIAKADLLAARETKNHVAFSTQLPTILEAVSALAVGPDADYLATYCAAVLQMHKAASAVTPAWVDADLQAFRAAEQAVVAAYNAL
ncbi:MAG: hypothetical protein IPL79_15890 [Myxococcales bacterium]|nr:hypothetical protein [Myxococcales bacterium]